MTRLKLWPTPKAPLAREVAAETPEVLGPAVTILGRVVAQGPLHVHGTVAGEVSAPRVVVGPEGTIEGDLYAEEAEIRGRVQGRIIAPVVVIGASARVEGRVFHHKLSVEDGAFVDGPMPWRPLNYFEELAEQAKGGDHERVYTKR